MSKKINVDQHEINKFEALASRWWNKQGDFKPLHDINPLRANWVDQETPVSGKTLLDIGCGGGIFSESMTIRGAKVIGIDMGVAPLSVAKMHALETNLEIDYLQCTAEELATQKPGSFDLVCCLEMLEHVPDPRAIIEACASLTKRGGTIYLSTINRNIKAFLFAIIGAEHILRMLPIGTHQYAKLIKPSELAHWARLSDLIVERIVGMTYNPITGIYKLTDKDLSVNYLMKLSKPL